MRTRTLVLVSTLTLLVLSRATPPAQADAIGIPDTTCPAGSSMQANHSGAWCEPRRACTADSDCYGSEVCSAEAVGVCFDSETYTVPTQICCPPPQTAVRHVARGPCGASCVAPAQCETARRCVPAASAPSSSSSSAVASGPGRSLGLCAVGWRTGAWRTGAARAGGHAVWLALAALLGAIVTRRVRARRATAGSDDRPARGSCARSRRRGGARSRGRPRRG